MLSIGILKSTVEKETRVALTPTVVSKLTALGIKVIVEKRAGELSGFSDQQYIDANAEVVTQQAVFQKSNTIITIAGISDKEIEMLSNHTLIGQFDILHNKDLVDKVNQKHSTLVALELMPRISRAQSIDILSSQNNLSGYQSIIEATKYYNSIIPMMMTAAGSCAPTKILVMGLGVAGLQAIATAKRLGANVSAYDIRPSTKDQALSLGAKFIELPSLSKLSDSTHAAELSDKEKQQADEYLLNIVKSQDIIVTTAQIPGKKSPILISQEMIENMQPGAVIIDMATKNGGNTVYSKHNQVVVQNNITIVSAHNLCRLVPYNASTFFANNIYNFINMFYNQETQQLNLDNSDDEILHEIVVCRDNKIIKTI